MRFNAAWRPAGRGPNRFRADAGAGAGGSPARNQRFLLYFLRRYGQRTTVPPASLFIAIAAGVGAGALVQQAAHEAVVILRFALSIAAGVAGFAVACRRLASDRAQQRAAIALASGLLNANRDCLKVLATDGKILQVSEHGAVLMEAESPEQLAGADWLGFWNAADRPGAKKCLGRRSCRGKYIFHGELRHHEGAYQMVEFNARASY